MFFRRVKKLARARAGTRAWHTKVRAAKKTGEKVVRVNAVRKKSQRAECGLAGINHIFGRARSQATPLIFTGRRADGGRRLYLGKYPDGGNRRQRKMLSRRIGIIEMFSRAGGSWNVPDNVRFHSNRSPFIAPEALRSNGNWLRCLRRMAPLLANSSKNPPPFPYG